MYIEYSYGMATHPWIQKLTGDFITNNCQRKALMLTGHNDSSGIARPGPGPTPHHHPQAPSSSAQQEPCDSITKKANTSLIFSASTSVCMQQIANLSTNTYDLAYETY